MVLTHVPYHLQRCNYLIIRVPVGWHMQQLPQELQGMVSDMICVREHNGAPSCYGIIIVFSVNIDKAIDHDTAVCLDTYAYTTLLNIHRNVDADRAWYFVGNVRSDQWEWEDETAVVQENTYQICLRLGKRPARPPLFPYSCHNKETVDPQKIMSGLVDPPPFVERISVSGVDECLLRDEWAECIAKVSNTFDGKGRGYRLHPMWILPEKDNGDEAGYHVREQSCHFEWPDYPGDRGEDW